MITTNATEEEAMHTITCGRLSLQGGTSPHCPSPDRTALQKCSACNGTGKDSKGRFCPACGGTGTATDWH